MTDHGHEILTLEGAYSHQTLHVYEDGYYEVTVLTTVGEEDMALDIVTRTGNIVSDITA